MNANQAKHIDLPNLMARMGYEPVSILKGGNELFYNSPFRNEKEPSFHVSRGKKYPWVWCDFGDTNGTVIDFVMRHEDCDFKSALQFLDDMYGKSPTTILKNNTFAESEKEPFLFSQETFTPNEDEEKDLEFLSVNKIQNPLIQSYLVNERGISRSLIDKYLSEVRYRNKKTGKEYFAFGIKNESGGYEIRAASSDYNFKSALKGRDITLIKGSKPDAEVNVIEGMTDFLSLCAMYDTEQLTNDTIIMHSTSSYKRTKEVIQQNGYSKIHGFMDNDSTGDKTTERFNNDFPDLFFDERQLYSKFKDLNQALISQQPNFFRTK